MRATPVNLGIAAAALFCTSLAQPHPYTQQTVELDLVFPRNDTYAPVDDFPLLWGLQNAHNAWEMGMMFSWQLQRIDLERIHLDEEWHVDQGVFPNPSYNGYPYTTQGPASSNPYFIYYFPDSLSKLSEGQWKLSWKFGFHISCSNNPLPEIHYHFKDQKPNELIFRFDRWEGETVDLLSLDNTTCADQATTFQIVDWTRSLSTHSDNCPVLSPTTPKPRPCTLHFNESLIEEMNFGAETGCSSATITQFKNRCKLSQASPLGGQSLYVTFGLFLLHLLL